MVYVVVHRQKLIYIVSTCTSERYIRVITYMNWMFYVPGVNLGLPYNSEVIS